MKIKNKFFPLEIYIDKNHQFFCSIEWFLFKTFNKKRTIPCGRTKKDKYLCCCQPIDEEHCYFNEDYTKAFCKCCGELRVMASHPINLKEVWI